jgi:hypothetical protein
MAEKIEFDLEVRKNQLNTEIDSATKKASALGDVLKTATGVFAGNIATKAFEVLTGSIGKAIDFANQSIKAFSEQEDALNKLGQALQASGDYSEEAVASFSEFASELQRTSKFGDEVVLSQLAVAKSLGATNEQAKQLVQAAANLSATFGGSLDENVLKLGKTLSGVTNRELTKILPQLKELSDEALKAGDAFAIVNDRFSGAAAAELNTYTGSIIAADNAFSDLQEEIGNVVVDVLKLREINNFLAAVYQTLTDKVLGFKESLQRGNEGFKETEGSINRLSAKYADLTTEIEIQQSRLKEYEQQAKTSFSAAGEVINAKNNIRELTKEYDALFVKINAFNNAPIVPETKPKASTALTDAQKATNEEILTLEQQLQDNKRNIQLQSDNLAIQDEFAKQAAEVERIRQFEQEKIDAEFEIKSANAEAKLKGEDERLALIKLNAEKELAIATSAGNARIKQEEIQRNKLKTLEQQKTQDKLNQLTIANNYTQALANVGAAFAKQGSKEAFYIQKAAALASVAIDDAKARTSATYWASTLGPVAGPAYLVKQNALITSSTALALSGIAASAIKGFEQGGIIGATMGPDNTIAKVRTGEMVLNADQQKNLFDMINGGGGGGGGDIVIQINEREIARAVRNQVQQGYKFA